MHFAYPLPWWLALLLAAASAALAFVAYRRPLAPLTPCQRGVLVALRALALVGARSCSLFRPVATLPAAAGARDAIVPVLVDVSRSMRLADADGETRIARARSLLDNAAAARAARQFPPELFAVGDGLGPGDADHLSADARRTDLAGALAAVRERYRGQRVAGIVLLSDGGDTGQAAESHGGAASGPPVFAIGDRLGRRRCAIARSSASPPAIRGSIRRRSICTSRAISSGFGRTPFQLRLLANGRVVDTPPGRAAGRRLADRRDVHRLARSG